MKKGDKVTIVVMTPFATTEKDGIVEMVKKNNIHIKGLEIPFDRLTGKRTDVFFGTKVYIKELAQPKQNGKKI